MSADTTKKTDEINKTLEYAVPVLGFGGALSGIIVWMLNVAVDIRISIIGCVFASWVLAYLAWIRPKKDIVALSTPIYSLIFLGFPVDNFSSVVLELLYAASLTILLVRLKLRFGAPRSAVIDKKILAGPLGSYAEKIREQCVVPGPGPLHSAAVVFVRFAEGEFRAAAQAAGFAIAQLCDETAPRCLQDAFAIVQEQADRLDTSLPRPETFHVFSPEDAGMLAKTPDPKYGRPEEYDTALENALLLLFAVAWNWSDDDLIHLAKCRAFAEQLVAP
ncbi:MAG: hypothetical protein ABFC71_11520 [Methanoregula sp.]